MDGTVGGALGAVAGGLAGGQDAALLRLAPQAAFAFMLILSRMGALVMLAPGLGEPQIPMNVRAALAAALALLLMPLLGPAMPPVPQDGWAMAAALAAELLAGAWFGWLARLVALALPAAAQLIAFMTGLANIVAPDPAGGSQVAALSRLFGLVPPLLLLGSGLYMLPLEAVVAGYRVIPPGSLLAGHDAVRLIVHGVGDSFALSVRLAAPFILAGTLWQMVLGLLARIVPSLQIYMVALPGQVLGGMALLAVTGPVLLGAWLQTARLTLAPHGGF